MAEKALCSIPGCGKPLKARGYCGSHYLRWLAYKDPLGGRIIRGTAILEIDRAFELAKPDECWPWPHAKDHGGRGKIRINGRLAFAHRVVCERRHGPPPSEQHLATHACGNGHLGCINPHHLRWGTQVENMADAIEHGTFVRGSRQWASKLTEAQVTELRSRYRAGGALQRELAMEYGISREQARDIINGKKWGWMDNFVEPPRTNRSRSKRKPTMFGPQNTRA